jgi:hypothetical protein
VDTVLRMDELWPHIRVINVYGQTESAARVATRSQ